MASLPASGRLPARIRLSRSQSNLMSQGIFHSVSKAGFWYADFLWHCFNPASEAKLSFAHPLDDRRIAMREEAAGARLQRRDGFYIVIRKLEVEDGQVLQHALLPHRLRKGDDAALNQPTKYDLSHGLAVTLGNRHQSVVLEQVIPSLGEGGPRLRLDAEPTHKLDAFGLLVKRIYLDLIDGRLDLVKGYDVHQSVGLEVAHAYAHALTLQKERNLTFVHPFDDPDVIAGQGTVAMEILRQHQKPIHAIFVPIGGGSLASGVATYVKAVRPGIKVIGVQTEDSCAMAQSLRAGERVELVEVGLFSDGTAVKLVGQETFRLCREHLDDVVTVDTDGLCAAMRDVFQDTRSVLEPAGALAVAGAKLYAECEGIENETLIAITSGANMNFDRLSFVAERAKLAVA